MGGDVPNWGAGTAILAVIQPLNGAIAANLYGERLKSMKLLLYDGTIPIAQGMGVCAEVAADQPCDYKIVSSESWAGHQRAAMEWIPPGRRA